MKENRWMLQQIQIKMTEKVKKSKKKYSRKNKHKKDGRTIQE